MGKMLSKVLRDVGDGLLGYKCPACGNAHVLNTDRSFGPDVPCWTFVGNAERPTFNPSVNCRKDGPNRCHSWVKNGYIEYLGDCQHAFANRTVPIPNWDDKNRNSIVGNRVFPTGESDQVTLAKPGDYAKIASKEFGQQWVLVVPTHDEIYVNPNTHQVIEYPNGKITVSGELVTDNWRGRLIEGLFISN